MAKLIYSAITSLDGYVADAGGSFAWAEPDEEVHAFVNDLVRPVGTYLYGRRLYEVMVAWDTLSLADQPPHIRDFAEIWRGTDKIVFSKTLETVSTPRTRIERDFDPEEIRQLKARAERDVTVGGPASRPTLSGQTWSTSATCSSRPSSWAVGNRHSPATSAWTWLLEERSFRSGMVFLRYRRGSSNAPIGR